VRWTDGTVLIESGVKRTPLVFAPRGGQVGFTHRVWRQDNRQLPGLQLFYHLNLVRAAQSWTAYWITKITWSAMPCAVMAQALRSEVISQGITR
jgi:hypothetical protein